MRLIVFIGPPGVGKGTQARLIQERLKIPCLATGALMRAAKSSGSAAGQKIAGYIDQGKLVPDDVIIAYVLEELERPLYRDNCLLDGFPRTVEQAEALQALGAERGYPLPLVIEMKAEPSELVRRIAERSKVEGRADDAPQTVAKRLTVYARQTAPVVDFYQRHGGVHTIDGLDEREEVFRQVRELIQRHFDGVEDVGMPIDPAEEPRK